MSLEEYPQPETKHAKETPVYSYQCRVTNVVDGDTMDAKIDLGFEMCFMDRVRLRDIDTREIHFVPHDSEEYDRGMVHKESAKEWLKECAKHGEGEYPRVLYSHNFRRGAYGRIIGDFWCDEKEQWLTRYLYNEHDDVELF